jgi:hypothetical protein
MSWFRRQKDSASDSAAETAVASELADFLAHATEGEALRQAVDARMLALTEADADTGANEALTGIVAGPTIRARGTSAGDERE